MKRRNFLWLAGAGAATTVGCGAFQLEAGFRPPGELTATTVADASGPTITSPRTTLPTSTSAPIPVGVTPTPTNEDAWNVELVGQIGGPTDAVAVRGSYAYLGVGPRLVILDVSDPAKPTEVGQSAPVRSLVSDLALAEARAYLVDRDGHLHVFDVADPTRPKRVGFVDRAGARVQIAGRYLYTTAIDYPPRLRVFDLANPSGPVEVGSIRMPSTVLGVAVTDRHAYVAAGSAGLLVVDVDDPTRLVEVGRRGLRAASRVAITGKHAYVVDRASGLHAFDISDPTSPTELGSLPGVDGAIAVEGSYVYAIGGGSQERRGGLRIVDVADPAHPVEVGTQLLPTFASAVGVAGHHAFVAAHSAGLRIVDVASPSRPRPVGAYIPPGHVADVAVLGGRAYVSDGWDGIGLHVLDVGDPSRPTKIGFYETAGYAGSVAVQGSSIYFAESARNSDGPPEDGMLRILDVADPSSPSEIATLQMPAHPASVAVVGTHVYVGESPTGEGSELVGGGVRIVDVAEPTRPTSVGFFGTPGQWSRVVTNGPYAFIAAGRNGLRIASIVDPSQPKEVASLEMTGGIAAIGVAVVGRYAYVTAGSQNLFLLVVDVADPAQPRSLGFYLTPGTGATGVAALGRHLYVADLHRGLFVFDVSNPARPSQVGAYRTFDHARALAVSGQYAYVADGDGGLVILRFVEDQGVRATPLAAAPTPAPTPTVDFSRDRVVTTLPAGSVRGQVGISRSRQPGGGPQALALGPDGRIHLLDTLNERVVTLGRDGSFQSETAVRIDYGRDLLVKPDGRMLVLGTEEVQELGPDGQVQQRLLIGKHIAPSVTGLARGDDAEIVVEIENASRLALTDRGAAIAPSAQGAEAHRQAGLTVEGSDLVFVVRYESPRRGGEIEVRGPNGVIRRLTVAVDHQLGGVEPLGVDAAGNTYLAVTELLPGNVVRVDRTVRRYAPDGTVQGVARVPVVGRHASVERDLALAPDGQVYALLVLADRALVLSLGFVEGLPPLALDAAPRRG